MNLNDLLLSYLNVLNVTESKGSVKDGSISDLLLQSISDYFNVEDYEHANLKFVDVFDFCYKHSRENDYARSHLLFYLNFRIVQFEEVKLIIELEEQEGIFNFKELGLIPICFNGGGEYLCLSPKLNDNSVYFLSGASVYYPDFVSLVYPSIEEMVNAHILAFNMGLLTFNSYGVFNEYNMPLIRFFKGQFPDIPFWDSFE